MKRKTIYYAQLGVALKYAQSSIFEYKRISLILFDNIIENLLISQNLSKLHHVLIMNNMKKNEYEKIIKSFNRFEKIINQSCELKLISISEKNIIEYCHKARNNLYHGLLADKRVVDYCILYYCDFLENKFLDFIPSYSESGFSIEEILRAENVNDLEEIVSNLKLYNNSQKNKPQKILSEIIEDYILYIESTMENMSDESFVKLNQDAKFLYKDFYKKISYNGINPSGFVKQISNIRMSEILKMKSMISEFEECSLEISFRKFHGLMLKLEPIYIGILLCYSNDELFCD